MPDDAKLAEMGTCATAWATEFRDDDRVPSTVRDAAEWFAAAIEAGKREGYAMAMPGGSLLSQIEAARSPGIVRTTYG